ncbi:hypothetical protein G9F73_010345 [Clostridium estertheticum]|uniref:hypothetical protein n=1 Tax=Clostridium estertheticum TaxID=238834 RepID=UPI0013EE4049|nr:hypothetical protein [Clostridium estertheticum]MBZ9608204.1 hypothetical protein [Clostridium estertheticum]
MEQQWGNLSSLEIRGLLMDTLAYEECDIDSEGKTFKRYGYQGTQSDLYRLAENLAIKRGMIPHEIKVSREAWGCSGNMLHARSTTNFSRDDIKNIYEQFHLVLNQGIIAPGAIGNYGPNLPSFHVTDYGLKCIEAKEVLPYDVDGYFQRIKNIPCVTEWVEFYIREALQCYNANCLEAAIIMLGLSSEKIIDEQIDSLSGFFCRNYTVEYGQMVTELAAARTASSKYLLFVKYLDIIKKRITNQNFKKLLPEMDSVAKQVYTNFTRITRNSLAHPSDTKMERIEVLMIFISFIKYCETQYGFINYFVNH